MSDPQSPVPHGGLPAALPLVGPGDPTPVTVLRERGSSRAVLLADHAGRAIPAALDRLGLDDGALARHIAYDIGIERVTRSMSAALDAPAVLSGYSRLVVDPNRFLDDPTAMPEVSDGTAVPGNVGLSPADRQRRADAFYWPYHRRAAGVIGDHRARIGRTAVIAMHSFTPVMDGFVRPWHIGILHDRDQRLVDPLLAALRRRRDLVVGDNQPYSGTNPRGFTIDYQAVAHDLPHLGIEIRQDLIDTRDGAHHWAAILIAALAPILADDNIFR